MSDRDSKNATDGEGGVLVPEASRLATLGVVLDGLEAAGQMDGAMAPFGDEGRSPLVAKRRELITRIHQEVLGSGDAGFMARWEELLREFIAGAGLDPTGLEWFYETNTVRAGLDAGSGGFEDFSPDAELVGNGVGREN